MSRFEVLNQELMTLRSRQAICSLVPGVGIGILIGVAVGERQSAFSGVVSGIGATIAAAVILHFAWRSVFPTYARWSERTSQLLSELEEIRARMAAVFAKYPDRRKGQQFKKAYDLTGKTLRELEESLSVGMHREGREVFVTAFMRNDIAVRVTAAIGSPYRCSASDNPEHWSSHVDRHECDEVRQYHNHPDRNGTTSPSPTDFSTAESLRKILCFHSSKLRSFVICWNIIGEWKIIEYEPSGRSWLHSEFDAAASQSHAESSRSGFA